MKMNKQVAGVVIFAGLLVGSLGAGLAFSGRPTGAAAAPAPQSQVVDPVGEEDAARDPAYAGSILVDEAQTEGMSEADEATALQGQAIISADEAAASAEAANPGARALKVELDNENGVLVYSVELDSGLDVKVDAADASVLHTEQDDEGERGEVDEAGDTDDVQEEHEAENEADDASEGPEAPEDAPEAPEAVPAP